jgi:CrcB protein
VRDGLGETAAVFAGGAIGTLLRLALVEGIEVEPGHWPWATFAANLAGAFVLGLVATRFSSDSSRAQRARALLGTGLCGALTTFSTFQLELLELLDRDDVGLAIGYGAASIGLGLALVVVATGLTRAARPAA